MVDEYRMSEKRAIRWRKAILIPDYILRRLGEEKRRSIGAAPSRHANRFECVEAISPGSACLHAISALCGKLELERSYASSQGKESAVITPCFPKYRCHPEERSDEGPAVVFFKEKTLTGLCR
jgi:hypothetical protein